MKKYSKPEISIVTLQNDDCLMVSGVFGAIKIGDLDRVQFSDLKKE